MTYMIRRRYYVPIDEIYRAYDSVKARNPGNFLFPSDFQEEEEEYGNSDTDDTQDE